MSGRGAELLEWSEGKREEAHSFLLMFFAFPPPFEHWRRAGVPFRDNEQAGERKGGASQSAHLDHWADRGSADGDGVRSWTVWVNEERAGETPLGPLVVVVVSE